jgi:hypothetical protein
MTSFFSIMAVSFQRKAVNGREMMGDVFLSCKEG